MKVLEVFGVKDVFAIDLRKEDENCVFNLYVDGYGDLSIINEPIKENDYQCLDAFVKRFTNLMCDNIALLNYLAKPYIENTYVWELDRNMLMRQFGYISKEHGYIPCYTRTELTDALHENAGFRTDYELTT